MTALRLDAIVVGDEPEAWAGAGFTVDGSNIDVAGVTISCLGDGSAPRWRLWSDTVRVPESVDGIPTDVPPTGGAPDSGASVHENSVVELDHVVLASPDLDRTTDVFGELDVGCRRVRDVPGSEPAMQQRFFRLGGVVLELVGRAGGHGDGPASIWGLAFTVADIDAAAGSLGAACGAPKDAVQEGRRIATVRTRDLGISLPIALMTPAPPRAQGRSWTRTVRPRR